MSSPPKIRKSDSSMHRGEPSESVMNLSGFMAYKMAQYVQESFDVYFKEIDVKARHFCVMRVLVTEGPMTQQRLCEALWIDRATMVGVIQVLEKLKYISKKAGKEDKRCFIVSLTSAGNKFYKTHVEEYEKLDRQVFAALSDSELKSLRTLLRKAMLGIGQ